MGLIDEILAERPAFHQSETEIFRSFDPDESLLPRSQAEELASGRTACYGIGGDVGYFIRDLVEPGTKSLETGAGISTLIFAIQGATHTAITPNKPEVDAIREYAKQKQISLERIRFVLASSDRFLPRAEIRDLDVVFLDGKHAFPWPIIDWFYTADMLRRGGIMILDDAQMKSVRILVDFMIVDPGWTLIQGFGEKTFAFRKGRESVHDVAWHMQPYIAGSGSGHTSGGGILSRIARKLKRAIGA